jgi:hypothetical protein
MAIVAEPRAAVRVALAVLALAATGPLADSALAGAPSPKNQARLDSTVRYLQNAQNSDGGFGGQPGAASDPDFSAWVALALAAAGINPQDQMRPGGLDAYAYLLQHASELTAANAECARSSCTTELERVLLVVDASGTSPHDFGGVDLVKELLERQLPDGSFPHEAGAARAGMNDTIFAILSLSAVGEPAVQDSVRRAADWVIAAQNSDGSWPATCPKTVAGCSAPGEDPRGEVDMTGAAVEALSASGRNGSESQQRAFDYLERAQSLDGGFPEFLGEPESNVASTAWAVQAIWSAGGNPESWLTGSTEGGGEPLGYLESMQQPDGHIRWRKSSDLNGVWMTAYVAPAFAGQALPIPAAPRAAKQPAPPAQPGQGEGGQSGKGTIAGGGGRGAQLFSRPKPQSEGRTPGGVRLIDSKSHTAHNHSKTRRGENTEQPTGTASSEARGDFERAGVGSAATGRSGRSRGGREVMGALVGSDAHGFGAPGLHGAGVASGGIPWPAIAIGTAALLCGLAGSQLERRRWKAFA